jgi:hypothetical protein
MRVVDTLRPVMLQFGGNISDGSLALRISGLAPPLPVFLPSLYENRLYLNSLQDCGYSPTSRPPEPPGGPSPTYPPGPRTPGRPTSTSPSLKRTLVSPTASSNRNSPRSPEFTDSGARNRPHPPSLRSGCRLRCPPFPGPPGSPSREGC